MQTQQPWLDYPPSSYAATSAYPIGSPSIAITPTHVSDMYDPAYTEPVGRSYSYSNPSAPPVANKGDMGMSGMRMAHDDIPQHSSYVPSTSFPTTQYMSSAGSTDFPFDDRAYEQSTTMWDLPAARDRISNSGLGPTNLSRLGQSSTNNTGYYGTHSMSRNYSIPSATSIPASESSSAFYSGYDYNLLSPTNCLGMEPRGSGTDSNYYSGSGTNHYSASSSKESKRSRYLRR